MELNSINIVNIKNNIENGNIFYINKDAKLEHVLILLKEIEYKGLDIVYLSELIKEQII